MRRNRNGMQEFHGLTRRELLSGAAAIAGGLLIGIDFGSVRAGEPALGGARMNAFIHVARMIS